MFEQLNVLPLDVCHKLIQKVGKGEIQGMIKKAPVLGLNGDVKLEGDSVNEGYIKFEGASGYGDIYDI